ncbi:calcium/proton exchanger [Gaeumannomyces tritici R3-111a-1]|uniref:Calcium/proton exchanger n=1 Tax=Gaeumannomyces tritici (strain R3-111a-1) TaxID=644352 RepID=J3NRW8_GAET3|nr:calcium/proton exchanger [Gaeumannomyces tritici R3-111a-1]EJT78924.1 calcium/proton exchanger [Gaeumannomyces tritici R3-111a-1]
MTGFEPPLSGHLASPSADSKHARAISPPVSRSRTSFQGPRISSDYDGHPDHVPTLNNTTPQAQLATGDSEYASLPLPSDGHPRDEAAKEATEPPGSSVNNVQAARAIPNGFIVRLLSTLRVIMVSSYVNVLLVFVPVGIAVGSARSSGAAVGPGLVFSMNSVAIIPLANLLSFATETMAARRGPAVGALMNVTFGNAVELIIFVIALVKNEIRIVQASLPGSILANLLLILGMCFLLGGLRFREQIYNPTVTQTMACLLSLSVISLVLPISRITSIVLLAVYILYLVFQLKTHAYLYKSLPQAMADQEAQPRLVAAFLHESSDRNSGDWASDYSFIATESVHSRKARSKRVLMRLVGRKRKASTTQWPLAEREPITRLQRRRKSRQGLGPASGQRTIVFSDAQDVAGSEAAELGMQQRANSARRPHPKASAGGGGLFRTVSAPRPRSRLRDTPSRSLTSGMFLDQQTASSRPTVRVGVRRTASLPGRLSQTYCGSCGKLHANGCQSQTAGAAAREGSGQPGGGGAGPTGCVEVGPLLADEGHQLSTRAATLLLLVSTGLVAFCAELMVGAISDMLAIPSSPLGEAFIGLIVLTIVGNAAEHVTAITVALKNKLDLAIAVSIGSSIQIALFVTPFIVMLGWALDRGMTLRFTLFETVCLFLAAFIANFLVLDGRSNYLEGALLLAAYVIIAVVAFYYPGVADTAAAAGGDH